MQFTLQFLKEDDIISEPRKRTYMGVQQLHENEYNWTSSRYDGRYSDKVITDNASKFADSNSSAYSYKSPAHYLYEVYQRYYWPLKNEYQHDFNDYKFIFGNKNLHDKARLIMLHVAMRLEFFSFVDYKRNGRYGKSKKSAKRRKFVPMKIASILHDADKSADGSTIVKPHVHYALKLGKSVTPTQLSKWSGIPPQYFSTHKRSSRYDYGNMLAYLTHIKQPQKHLYNYKRVWANFDYQAYYKSHYKQWSYYRATISKKSISIAKNLFEQKVRDGQITDQMSIRNKRYYDIRASMTTNINELFTLRARRTAYLLSKALMSGKFSISIFYIYGRGGSGKTKLADHLVQDLKKRHPNWDSFQTASSNNGRNDIFEGYKGAPIIYMNEAKPDDLDPGAWETLLDPHHIQGLGSRYHNKVIGKRVLILTTTYTPEMFFGLMKGSYKNVEEMGQFMRRVTNAIQFIKASSDSQALDGTVAIRHPVKYTKPRSIIIRPSNGAKVKRMSKYILQPRMRRISYADVVPEKTGLKYMIDIVESNNANRDHRNDRTYLSPEQYKDKEAWRQFYSLPPDEQIFDREINRQYRKKHQKNIPGLPKDLK